MYKNGEKGLEDSAGLDKDLKEVTSPDSGFCMMVKEKLKVSLTTGRYFINRQD